MKFLKSRNLWGLVAKVFLIATSVNLLFLLIGGSYFLGYYRGILIGHREAESRYASYIPVWLENFISSETNSFIGVQGPQPSPALTPTPAIVEEEAVSLFQSADWGGPELWDAVNARRVEFGVNALNQRDELCTIASIRLNELLELGKLDAHEGFGILSEKRQDLEWIFEKYKTMAEFLAAGGDSPQDTVNLWENTLGHKKLLTGGEYVWGCIYAQNSFAVAITAF